VSLPRDKTALAVVTSRSTSIRPTIRAQASAADQQASDQAELGEDLPAGIAGLRGRLTVAGMELEVRPRISFRAVAAPRGRVLQVPDRLPRLEPEFALHEVELPVALNWSQPGRVFRPVERSERARSYEIVLREGVPDDVLRYVDGVLLIDIWDELVLPRYVPLAWDPLIRTAVDAATIGAASWGSARR
jgi:hypothetical protein